MKLRNKKCLKLAIITFVLATIAGCGLKEEATEKTIFEQIETKKDDSSANSSEIEGEVISNEIKNEINNDEQSSFSSDEGDDNQALFDKFLNDEIEAQCINEDGSTYSFKYSELPHDPEEWDSYFASDEKVDLDNDGNDELILTGPYGGMYLDARDDSIYVLAQGEGTAGELSYVTYEGKIYIAHRDTSHGGRQIYNLECYNGNGEVVDSFVLSAEYWDSEDDTYNESSDFTFKDQKITMEEFENLRKEIFGY